MSSAVCQFLPTRIHKSVREVKFGAIMSKDTPPQNSIMLHNIAILVFDIRLPNSDVKTRWRGSCSCDGSRGRCGGCCSGCGSGIATFAKHLPPISWRMNDCARQIHVVPQVTLVVCGTPSNDGLGVFQVCNRVCKS